MTKLSTDRCPICGAQLPAGESCNDVWFRTQVKEFTDPAYGAVHHLSVPSYMIQHNAYSRSGFGHVRRLLQRFVDGLDPQYYRKTEGNTVDNGQRDFSITRGEKIDQLNHIEWSFTVSDVHLDTPEHYCQDVRAWAKSVLKDTAHLEQ